MNTLPDKSGEATARRFHEAYERLAPQYGYATRKETRQFDPATPNGALMIAVCEEVFAPSHEAATDPGTEKILRTLLDRVYKIFLMSGALRVQGHDPESNDPIIAWMSDARAVLYGSTKPEPDPARLA